MKGIKHIILSNYLAKRSMDTDTIISELHKAQDEDDKKSVFKHLKELEQRDLNAEQRGEYLYYKIFTVSFVESNLDLGFELLEQMEDFLKQNSLFKSELAARFWFLKAMCLSERNEWEESLIASEKRIEIANDIGLYNQAAWGCYRNSLVLFSKGDLNEVLQQLQKGEEAAKKFDNHTLGAIFANYALYYAMRSEFDLCKEYLEKAKRLIDENSKMNRAPILRSLGRTYFLLGNLEDSLEYFKKASEYSNFEHYVYGELWANIAIIELWLLLKDNEKAKTVFQVIKKNDEFQSEWRYNVYIEYTEALLLKAERNLRDTGESIKLFEKLLEEDGKKGKLDVTRLTIPVIRHLTDLYIDELKLYGEEKSLKIVNDLISQLKDYSSQQGLFTILVESLILESKLMAVQGMFDNASTNLNTALELSKGKGLNVLVAQIGEEIENMTKSYEEVKTFVETNPSWNDRIVRLRISEYIHRATSFMSE